MSLYILAGNDCKSSINEAHTSRQKIICPIFNQANLVGWMLDDDAKNVTSHRRQNTIFVTMRLKYMEGFASVLSTII